ncbi:hypothetical protein LguiB_013207 [Lonicera macranthoides]
MIDIIFFGLSSKEFVKGKKVRDRGVKLERGRGVEKLERAIGVYFIADVGERRKKEVMSRCVHLD